LQQAIINPRHSELVAAHIETKGTFDRGANISKF